MGTSATFDEAAAKCLKVDIDQLAVDAGNHAAFIFKKHLKTGIAAAVGSDMEFTEGGGIPVSVRYRLNGAGPVLIAEIYPTGPVHWLRGTKPHRMPRKRKAVKFEDGEIRHVVEHPGSRNRLTWERDKERAIAEAERAIAEEFEAAVRRVFG